MGPALIAVVVLYLTVHDADTGKQLCPNPDDPTIPLCKLEPVIVSEVTFAVDNNPMEQCRKFGVDHAKATAAKFRQTYPNATVNVKCTWEHRVSGEPA